MAKREAFEAFVDVEGARLHRVLCAHFGLEQGPEVTADALSYAWEHWGRVGAMANPCGYLYRVAQSSLRRRLRPSPTMPLPLPAFAIPEVETELEQALARLPATQRTAVVLVHALDWSLQDAATAMSVSVSTLRNHLRRGLARLRAQLGDRDD